MITHGKKMKRGIERDKAKSERRRQLCPLCPKRVWKLRKHLHSVHQLPDIDRKAILRQASIEFKGTHMTEYCIYSKLY